MPEKSLPDFSRAHVLVVGDVMLDRYWYGDTSRVSPEAPVVIVQVQESRDQPGGAANVARNITALGGRATLLSVVGDDEAGRELGGLLKNERVDARLHIDPELKTTVKIRVVSRGQQVVRIDFETPPSHEVLDNKLGEFELLVDAADVVILSDYGKGGLTHVAKMIAVAKARGKPVLVDPKGDDYSKYRGATLLTPNRSEFREVAGRWKTEAELESKAEALRGALDLVALMVTRSEEGMSLFTAEGADHHPTRALEVSDVSGAGDTVIATMGLMMAAGASLTDAMHAANAAAGVVVGKLGTATVSREELGAVL
ncbi:MAG: D-glycero-beta-D-manno-heptose-7-phosphate kinase [Betaproteobacteria bacterium]|nr:D-glycero-beta-D-manno-heptose-7-phosphate kinase [Betaproteobacteria bacterium]